MTIKDTELVKAFDSNTVNGKLISLNEEQASSFIDEVADQSTILKKARIEKMNKPIKTVARILDTGVFLKPSTGRSTDEVAGIEFGSETIELVSKEVTGNIMIWDQDIQDNIEGAALTNHLLGIITKKIANELENAAIFGIKKESQVSILDMFDGFRQRILKGGQVVDASALSNPRVIDKDKFTAAFKKIPVKYRSSALAFFMASDTVIDYNNLYDSNVNRDALINKTLGLDLAEVPLMPIDLPVPTTTATTTTNGTSAKGQKNLNVAAITGFTANQTIVIGIGTAYQQVNTVASTSTGVLVLTNNITQDIPATAQTVTTCTLDGTDVILGDPRNMIVGMQTTGMSFETLRIPNKGYKYFYKTRLDFQVEQPLAATLLKNLKNK